MRNVNELTDINVFFFYGSLDLDLEIESDIFCGLLQDKRSLFYARSEGAGISERENYPNTLMLEIGIRYDIAQWINYRNTQVGDGTNNTKDRRVATSQMAINTKREQENLDVEVYYIPFHDYNDIKSVNVKGIV